LSFDQRADGSDPFKSEYNYIWADEKIVRICPNDVHELSARLGMQFSNLIEMNAARAASSCSKDGSSD
jgi:hypothetical protein